ncbi:MAG: sulfate ABC transporter substrate-binding protein, partial [Thermocrispum sp.]
MSKGIRFTRTAALAVAGVLAVTACGTASGTAQISLVAFSVTKAATDDLQAAFARTAAGRGVAIQQSYGASGDQSRAVASGLKADYVHCSLPSDLDRLVDAGLVARDWNAGPAKGIAARSVVVLVVRKGNPKQIDDWNDLVKPGVGIVSPNPGSSGSARWNILAAYGAAAQHGGEQAGTEYLRKFFRNVRALPGSARDATTAFTGGTGDVLISYESEAIFARQKGEDFDYVVPDTTLLIETPAAITTTASPQATAWREFVFSKAGQTEFARFGWRPAVPGVHVGVRGANDPANAYPEPRRLLTIDGDFGGWSATAKKFFDANDGLVTRIQQQAG